MGLGFGGVGTDELGAFVGLVDHVVFGLHHNYLVREPGIPRKIKADLSGG